MQDFHLKLIKADNVGKGQISHCRLPDSSDLDFVVLNLHKGLPLWKRWPVEKESLT